MSRVILGALGAIALLGLVWLSFQAYRSHQLTTASATYLFSQTEVRDKSGKALSRAELFDMLLQQAIAQKQASGPAENLPTTSK
jgi:hypothetical protein